MRKNISTFREVTLLTMLDIIKKQMKNYIFEAITDIEIDKMTLLIDKYIIYEKTKDHINHLI